MVKKNANSYAGNEDLSEGQKTIFDMVSDAAKSVEDETPSTEESSEDHMINLDFDTGFYAIEFLKLFGPEIRIAYDRKLNLDDRFRWSVSQAKRFKRFVEGELE